MEEIPGVKFKMKFEDMPDKDETVYAEEPTKEDIIGFNKYNLNGDI